MFFVMKYLHRFAINIGRINLLSSRTFQNNFPFQITITVKADLNSFLIFCNIQNIRCAMQNGQTL